MKKKKNKVPRLTQKDYENYIQALKGSRPAKAIAGGKEKPVVTTDV